MQSELFSPGPDPAEPERLVLEQDSLSFWRHALDPQSAATLMAELLKEIPWRQEYLWLGGQKRAIPRLQCWMGERRSHYGYSGMRLQPEPWHESVLTIREKVEALSRRQFNSVLLNLYRNGQDSVSWHADDERELGPHPVVASISLGAERQFQLKRKAPGARCQHRLSLPSGSLLLMEEGIQDRWLHQIPKQKHIELPRINLTFRQIVRN